MLRRAFLTKGLSFGAYWLIHQRTVPAFAPVPFSWPLSAERVLHRQPEANLFQWLNKQKKGEAHGKSIWP